MKIQYKFYLYFVVTVLLSPVLFTEISLVYSAGHIIDILLVSLILLVYFGLYLSIRKDFLLPYANLQDWVLGFKSNQSMRLDEAHDTTFQPVATAINHLIDENQHLYDDMESILKKQIQRLSHKSASLETLYNVSSKLNQLHSTDELFEYFLGMFASMTGASSGAARSLAEDGELYLVAQRGVIDPEGQQAQILNSDCFCGEVAMAKQAGVQFSVHTCGKCVGNKSREIADVGTIFIPLRHHGKTLGIFNLFFDSEPSLSFDERALLESIAENIAIALDKSTLNEQTKRMELSQERLFLSQEIHDSLAQTIYSLKLQVSVLGNSLKQAKQLDAYHQVEALQTNITQANQELRELMCNFRVPLDPKGIEVSLENLVNRFKSEEGIATFLQVKGKIRVEPEVEMQIMRITQEALSNIRKHAGARNVRILLTAEPYCQLLIEDDGIGFVKDQGASEIMGNNIGMNIMKERAQRVGAQIEVESEVDEGTRITVNFSK
ncbi:ATP-binding protein [Candidatus Thioglobus sp.]|jgi:two-component system nitrate/nitrite sensor histidine kinase NarX|uniref:GAF domain-containing sensor histidine kinase n=1 Tax=Candidatus Thioglobus sp. TaxID=2026721 RepID=UPI001DCC0675|nr:ATP-binding protein [Candidatus Thioglobus sp.]MBT3277684.1 GAF domain-containing protein [Candidatus Thioglobus sp.]MBT4746878.1 GAF domain-containing protein [Candidatus Thioglobus sp.]MBT5164419.1 GAF domain-containing protein [Candidatus Thioglobus sp.]MBT7127969.1 GAF domain-containing protein [Candidatus Thioglobus sp.]MBT7294869.1 GAF domain-containing protein [Candidatus Thioglobus sp.]